jgi:hypothetical protein
MPGATLIRPKTTIAVLTTFIQKVCNVGNFKQGPVRAFARPEFLKGNVKEMWRFLLATRAFSSHSQALLAMASVESG